MWNMLLVRDSYFSFDFFFFLSRNNVKNITYTALLLIVSYICLFMSYWYIISHQSLRKSIFLHNKFCTKDYLFYFLVFLIYLLHKFDLVYLRICWEFRILILYDLLVNDLRLCTALLLYRLIQCKRGFLKQTVHGQKMTFWVQIENFY